MSQLSIYGQDLLDACARAMVKGEQNPNLDLYLLNHEGFSDHLDDILDFLTQRVEANSDRRLTTRRVDPLSVTSDLTGVALSVAVCPIDTPSRAVIMARNDDFIPYCIVAANKGLARACWVDTETVIRQRANNERWLKQREAGTRMQTDIERCIHDQVQVLLRNATPQQRDDVEYHLRGKNVAAAYMVFDILVRNRF